MVTCFCGALHYTWIGKSSAGSYYEMLVPPEESLQSLRQVMDFHINHDCNNAEEIGWFVHRLSKHWIQVPTICLPHMAEALKLGEEAAKWIFKGKTYSGLSMTLTCLGMLTAEVVANRMTGVSATLSGNWEKLVWMIVHLVTNWDTVTFSDQSPCLLRWILDVLSKPSMCANPQLGLEMLRFIAMWSPEIWQSWFYGSTVATGLVAQVSYLQLHHLMSNSPRPCLADSLTIVLFNLQKPGYLRRLTINAINQVKDLRIGPEVRCLSHLVELVRDKAMTTLHWYQAGYWNEASAMMAFENVFILLNLLITTAHTRDAFEKPGLAQVAATSIVISTTSFVEFAEMTKENDQQLVSIFDIINKIFKLLLVEQIPKSTYLVLVRDHGQQLQVVFTRAKKLELVDLLLFSLDSLEQRQKSTEECSEEFLDSLTQEVMEAPVLLHSSKMVVDESTLVNLLLQESPSDPFTRCPLDHGSYSRLPDLQTDIFAWRNSSWSIQDIAKIMTCHDDT